MADEEDDSDDGKEWKSSHDRFVEALERFTIKMEKEQEKQFGFYLEISRDEMWQHFEERAQYYRTEAQLLSESGVTVPDMLKSADGSPMIDSNVMAELERQHKIRIDNMRGKSKAFMFASKHLPVGKRVFILSAQEATNLEFIPPEVAF